MARGGASRAVESELGVFLCFGLIRGPSQIRSSRRRGFWVFCLHEPLVGLTIHHEYFRRADESHRYQGSAKLGLIVQRNPKDTRKMSERPDASLFRSLKLEEAQGPVKKGDQGVPLCTRSFCITNGLFQFAVVIIDAIYVPGYVLAWVLDGAPIWEVLCCDKSSANLFKRRSDWLYNLP